MNEYFKEAKEYFSVKGTIPNNNQRNERGSSYQENASSFRIESKIVSKKAYSKVVGHVTK